MGSDQTVRAAARVPRVHTFLLPQKKERKEKRFADTAILEMKGRGKGLARIFAATSEAATNRINRLGRTASVLCCVFGLH